jgi:hypothetical protein
MNILHMTLAAAVLIAFCAVGLALGWFLVEVFK